MKVLVVDDEPVVRRVCRAALKDGFEVREAESAEAAALDLGGIEIVVTDLHMPGALDGGALTRLVRSTTSADVIVMTGQPELETAIAAVHDGAYDYVVKPFEPAALRAAVLRCADKRRLSAELARERALRAELDRAYSELRQTHRAREIFGQFTTPEVARFVLEHPDDFWKRGERREVTMLFADVRSFTPFAGRVSPEEAVTALNDILMCVVLAVQKEGGILNKFLGDGAMAFFGAPTPLEDHAAAGARAAIGARRRIEELAEARAREGRVGLRMGIGVNTGPVVAGCLGTRERTEYSVIGHAVNVAARLQAVAPAGAILLGPETVRLLAGRFEIVPKGPAMLPGIADPVEVSELRSEKPCAA